MTGLLDERRGRRGPVKLLAEIVEFIRDAGRARAQLAEQVAARFGVDCTGAPSSGPGSGESRSLWPPAEAAQADYETLRAHLLGLGGLPDAWPRHGSPAAGWPG